MDCNRLIAPISASHKRQTRSFCTFWSSSFEHSFPKIRMFISKPYPDFLTSTFCEIMFAWPCLFHKKFILLYAIECLCSIFYNEIRKIFRTIDPTHVLFQHFYCRRNRRRKQETPFFGSFYSNYGLPVERRENTPFITHRSRIHNIIFFEEMVQDDILFHFAILALTPFFFVWQVDNEEMPPTWRKISFFFRWMIIVLRKKFKEFCCAYWIQI